MLHPSDRTGRDHRNAILVILAIVMLLSPYVIRKAQKYYMRPSPQYHLLVFEGSELALGIGEDSNIKEVNCSPYLLPFLYKKLPINEVDEVLIQTIPGVGPALARRIIEDRERNGVYNTANDLTRVYGIGFKKAQDLELYLSFSTIAKHSD